ncbi:hypothetical protein EVAR_42701_1 [Eumeta japonica]|uniref:Uncharacterized protein n=1 Tax=Eumeta variegata TaxID=151549 RepID=A0A4C1WYF4_EUMVA|nr:hypothetical protein EVAR_42701_1 [Eumeta japonica]
MCIRTVMTYASPVFAHAALKALHRLQGLRTPHHFQIYEGTHRSDSSTSRDHIPMRSYARRLTINRRIPPTLSVATKRHRPKLPTPPAANRLRPGEEGNRPVTVSCDILCRDDFHQASSIAHVTRRRHSHVPSGRTRYRACRNQKGISKSYMLHRWNSYGIPEGNRNLKAEWLLESRVSTEINTEKRAEVEIECRIRLRIKSVTEIGLGSVAALHHSWTSATSGLRGPFLITCRQNFFVCEAPSGARPSAVADVADA